MIASEMTIPSNKCRVVFLASTLVTGGAEMVVRSLALGLPDRDISTRLVCIRDPGPLGMELSLRGVDMDSSLARRRYDISVFSKLVRAFRSKRDDVLVCLDHHDAVFWGGISSRFAGVTGRILSVHSTGLWGRSGTLTTMDRRMLPLFDRVIALADNHAGYLATHEGVEERKIEIINNGIDIERFRPAASGRGKNESRKRFSLDPETFVVTIVAALRPEKNHEMFLRSAADIIAEGRDFKFLVVGDGKEAGKLHELATELSLGESVIFLGNRDDVQDIYSVSDVSVLCSSDVVETFPLSVLEAMASGIPVVATSVGSITEIIDDGVEGFVIPPGDREALTSRLMMLEEDTTVRREMGRRARERVEKRYSEELMIDRYAEVIMGILKEKRGGDR